MHKLEHHNPGFQDVQKISKELHHKIIKHYPRRKVFVNHKDEIWGADLCEMPIDNGYKYILTVIDIYTKYAWAIPLKNKKGETIKDNFEKIINKSKRKCEYLWVDHGLEFYNKIFQSYLDKNNIIIYSTESELKNSVIERFNRTLKEMMMIDLTTRKLLGLKENWVDLIPYLLEEYNNRNHSTINMSPIEASKPESQSLLEETWRNHLNNSPSKSKPLYKVGDFVRIYRWKNTFEKGFKQNWTTEIFRIKRIMDTNPICYKLEDLDGEDILGSFYNQQLLKTATLK
jgi:hypothetical protein